MREKEKGSDPIINELLCIGSWVIILESIMNFRSHPMESAMAVPLLLAWLFFNPKRFDLINLTHGWLINWENQGNRFTEWVRSMSLTSINHGWFYALSREPVILHERVCHVLGWVPILFYDADWDHAYLLIMMREKLRRMRLHHEEEKIIGDWEKVAKEIAVAECYLDRLIKGDYCAADYEEHHKKYGSIWDRPKKEENGMTSYESNPDPECGNDVRRIADKEEKLMVADLEAFGQHFAKHCRNWWS